jgi:integrase
MSRPWIADRSRVLAPSTLTNLVTLVRSVFNTAALDRLIASSPAVRLSLPRSERERVVPLTIAQVSALADAMPERCRAMVVAQAALGLRIGELLALRLEDVSFLGRNVRIEHQLSRDGKELVAPKTPRSRRTVPLPQVVAEALAEHIQAFPIGKGGYLFSSARGNPWRQLDYVRRAFRPGVERAGLPAGTGTHDLRHHYASVLLAAGESVVAVAERLGHENATLVLTTYGHLLPDSEDRTRRAIDAAWKQDATETKGLAQ